MTDVLRIDGARGLGGLVFGAVVFGAVVVWGLLFSLPAWPMEAGAPGDAGAGITETARPGGVAAGR